MNTLSIKGEISRADWWRSVFLAVAGFVVVTVALFIFSGTDADTSLSTGIKIINATYCLVFVPLCVWVLIASSIKRYHDRGKSGWWILLALIPVLGLLWQVIELGFLKSKEGNSV